MMENAQYQVGAPFWPTVKGLLVSIAWEQTLAALITFLLLKCVSKCVHRRVSSFTTLGLSIGLSFFVWPSISSLWLHILDPTRYPQAFIPPLSDLTQQTQRFVIGVLFVQTAFNQNALVIPFVVLPTTWMLVAPIKPHRPLLAHAALALLLPVSWLIHFSDTAS